MSPLKDPVARRAWDKAHYIANREKVLARDRFRRFGVSAEQFRDLLNKQEGRCAICLRELKPSVEVGERRGRIDAPQLDHDHETGAIRLILCASCNRGLGIFQDNPELLRRALGYLTLAREPRS